MKFPEDVSEINEKGEIISKKEERGPEIPAWYVEYQKGKNANDGITIEFVDMESETPLVKRKKKPVKNLTVAKKVLIICGMAAGIAVGSVGAVHYVHTIKDSQILKDETDRFYGIVNRNTHRTEDNESYYYDVDAIVNEVNTLSNLYYYHLDQKTSAPIAIYSITCDIYSKEAKDEFVRGMGTVISSNSEFYCDFSGFDYSSYDSFIKSAGCENLNDLKKELISDLKEGKKQVK